MQPFSPIFPLTESIARHLIRLSLWKFNEKASAIFYDTAFRYRGGGERRPTCLSEGMPLFLGFPSASGEGRRQSMDTTPAVPKGGGTGMTCRIAFIRHRRATASGASQGLMMGGLEAIVAGGRARVPHGMERGRQRLP